MREKVLGFGVSAIRSSPVFHVLEMLRDEFDKVLVIKIASRADNKIAGREVVSIKAIDVTGRSNFFTVSRVPSMGIPERVVFPEAFG